MPPEIFEPAEEEGRAAASVQRSRERRREAIKRRRRRRKRIALSALVVLAGIGVVEVTDVQIPDVAEPASHSPAQAQGESPTKGATKTNSNSKSRPGRISIPDNDGLSSAWKFVAHQPGLVSAAVIDSRGHMHAVNGKRRYVSASTVKAVMLATYLRGLVADGEQLDSESRAILTAMITASDNNAANTIYSRLDDEAIQKTARLAGAKTLDVQGYWAATYFTARDCASFMWNVRKVLPARYRAFAMGLLSHIVDYERWGIPDGAGPKWDVWFKGGWRQTGIGALTHQMGLLNQRGKKVAIAVLTDGMPSMQAGIDAIEGVTVRLLPNRVARPGS